MDSQKTAAFHLGISAHAYNTLANEKPETSPRSLAASAPAARDKKPCANSSFFPRRLPKMAEGQVRSLRGLGWRGVGGIQTRAELGPVPPPTYVVKLKVGS